MGNPKGRGKGMKNFNAAFMKAMNQKVTVSLNGKPKKISKLDAAAMQLANNAARGDKNSIQFAVTLMQALEPPVQAEQDMRTIIVLPSNGREKEQAVENLEDRIAAAMRNGCRPCRPTVFGDQI